MKATLRYIADSKYNIFTATPAFHHGHLTLMDMIDPSRTTVTIHESELTHNRRFREVSKAEAESIAAEYAK